MQLKNKNIVITGGTSGIGYELVKRLSANNLVLVIGRDQSKLNALADAMPNVCTVTADLSQCDDVRRAAEAIDSSFDSIDLLINNAAVQFTPRLSDPDFDVDSIRIEIGVNLTAVCELTALLLPKILASAPSTILNVNSGLALAPKTESAVYCATKSALDSFTRSLRYQVGDAGVTVLQGFLPLVDTPMTEGRGSKKVSAEIAANKLIEGIRKRILDHDIGRSKLLRLLMRVSPRVARRIMR